MSGRLRRFLFGSLAVAVGAIAGQAALEDDDPAQALPRTPLYGLVSPSGIAVDKSALASPTYDGYFPEVELITQDGRRVRFYSDLVKGKTVAINFMFTTCLDICPAATANLTLVQDLLGKAMGEQIYFYSITLEPALDTPQILGSYARSIGAGPGWLFLTGRYEDIERLRWTLGVYDLDPALDADKTQHGGLLVYGNERLGRWAAIPATVKPELIAETLSRAMSRNKG